MNRIARLFAAAVITAGSLVAAGGAAHACSCAPATTDALFDRADHVFDGRVLAKKQQDDRNVRYVVLVRKEFKGDVPGLVNVITANSEASCGLELESNKSYQFFAKGAERSRNVEANLCGGTQAFDGKPLCGN